MGITKGEDVITWVEDQKILCTSCSNHTKDKPLTWEDFDEGDIVICDSCGERIL